MSTQTDRPLSIGVLSAGELVATVHLPVLTAMAEARVAWVMDRDAARGRRVAAAFGTKFAAVPEDLARLPESDVVLVGIPFGARAGYYEALSARGVPLYLEKPMFGTLAEHRAFCGRYPEHALAHGYQRRSFGPTQLVRRAVAEAPFGALRRIRFEMGTPGIVTHGGFRADARLAGGFMLFEHGIHTVLYLTDAKGVEVRDVAMELDGGMDLHTEIALSVETEAGLPVECDVKLSSLEETRNAMELEFENARLRYSIFDQGGRIDVRTRGGAEFVLGPAPLEPHPLASYALFREHWAAFLDGLRREVANHTSAHRALLTTEVVERCYAAGRGGSG